MVLHSNGDLTPVYVPTVIRGLSTSSLVHCRGEGTAEAIWAFQKERGYKPRVFVAAKMVCGVAPSQRAAAPALEVAKDAALLKHLARAFGGIEYMSQKAMRFIEGWEAETYRSSQV